MGRARRALIGTGLVAMLAGLSVFLEADVLGATGTAQQSVSAEVVPVRIDHLAAPGEPAIPQGNAGPTRVALYGDSLASEAQRPFVQAVTAKQRAVVQTHVFGGTAICDWLAQMRADAAAWHPQAVVVEFSGNVLTACMRDSTGAGLRGAARDARYAFDARQVVDIFSPTGTRLYFASYPIFRSDAQNHSRAWNSLNSMYAALAVASPGVRFFDAAQAVEGRGSYTDTLPCLASEPCLGAVDSHGQRTNVVRAPDGVHFCPGAPNAVDGVTGGCPLWSSGSFRYGLALAAPVLKDFGA